VTLGIQNRNVTSQTALAWARPAIAPTESVALLKKHRVLYGSGAISEGHFRGSAVGGANVALTNDLMTEIDVLQR